MTIMLKDLFYEKQNSEKQDSIYPETYFPYSEFKKGQRKIIDAVRSLPKHGKLMIEATTGSGKTVASLSSLIARKGKKQKILIFVKTINQINPVLREWKEITNNSDEMLLILPLLGKGRLCDLEFKKSRNTVIDCNSRKFREKSHWKKKLQIKELEKKNLRYRLLKLINHNFQQSEPTVVSFKRYLKTRDNCPYYNSQSVIFHADIIVTTYGYLQLNQFPRFLAKLKVTIEDTLILIDEAHNLAFEQSYSLHKPYLQLFMHVFNSTEFLQLVEEEIRGLRFLNFEKLVGKNELHQGIQETKRQIGRAKQLLRTGKIEEIIDNHPYQFSPLLVESELRNEILNEILREMDSFFNNIHNGRIIVSKERLNVIQVEPHLILDQVKSAEVVVLQSATFSPLPYFRDLFGLEPSTQLLDLTERDIRKIRKNKQEFRASYISAISSIYRFRNPSLFRRFTKIILRLIETNPNHTLILCPSYEFVEDLSDHLTNQIGIKLPLIKETPTSSTKELHQKVLNMSSKGIVIGNQNGKMMEGNEWRREDQSLVNLVIFAGLSTHIPRDEQELVDRIRTEILHDRDIAKLFANQIPVYIRAKQALGRTTRSPTDKGALIILDGRADRYLQQSLQLLRYTVLEELVADLALFFRGVEQIV